MYAIVVVFGALAMQAPAYDAPIAPEVKTAEVQTVQVYASRGERPRRIRVVGGRVFTRLRGVCGIFGCNN